MICNEKQSEEFEKILAKYEITWDADSGMYSGYDNDNYQYHPNFNEIAGIARFHADLKGYILFYAAPQKQWVFIKGYDSYEEVIEALIKGAFGS